MRKRGLYARYVRLPNGPRILPQDLDRLNALAIATDTPRDTLVRAAIVEYLDKYDLNPKEGNGSE